LRAYAAGGYAIAAGVELLIGHRRWLTRPDFLGRFVTVLPADPRPADGEPMALIDWSAAAGAVEAGELPCSSGEEALLRVAASLAGGVAVELGRALTRLDAVNLARVVQAIRHAGGDTAGQAPVGGGRAW
jgi:hypothetical protein